MPTVSSPRSGRMKTDKNNRRIDGNECLDRYLRDVWRYSVLSRERTALAKHIVESRTQWQKQLNTSAYSPVVGLEVPYMSGISAPDVPLPPRSYAHCY